MPCWRLQSPRQASGERCRTGLPAEAVQPVAWSCLRLAGQRQRLGAACGASGCSGGSALACCLTAQAAAAAAQGSAVGGALPEAGERGILDCLQPSHPADARLRWQAAAGHAPSWLAGGMGCGSCPPGGRPAWPLSASSHRRPCTHNSILERFVQLPADVRRGLDRVTSSANRQLM